MKKAMFIGAIGCGKTSFIQKLNELQMTYNKTQTIEFYNNVIDTPGEYLENRCLYSALITTSCDADIIALVQSADCQQGLFAPMFATAFNKPVIGIITKADTAKDEAALSFATNQLRQAGAEYLFVTSSITGDGISPLLDYLN